jgi:serine/threonine protein kinase
MHKEPSYYESKEIKEKGEYSKASDIWALGIIFIELLINKSLDKKFSTDQLSNMRKLFN